MQLSTPGNTRNNFSETTVLARLPMHLFTLSEWDEVLPVDEIAVTVIPRFGFESCEFSEKGVRS